MINATQADGRRSPDRALLAINLVLIGGLLLNLSLAVGRRISAQGSGWSEPVNVSNSLTTSWFPAIAVDGLDRVHIVWSENFRDRNGLASDCVWYAVWDGRSWSRPNDLFASPGDTRDSYTQRPALAVDRANNLHLLYRYPTTFYYMRAPADAAWSAQSWTSPHPVSGGQGEWVDIAVDSNGVVHAIWSEMTIYVLPGGVSVLSPGHTLFNKADDTWTTYTPSDGLAGDNVLDIAIDASGLKWFATDGGLSVLPADGSRWMTYTARDGLVSEQVQKVLIDGLGNKWLATQNGVSVLSDGATPFDNSDDVWATYTAADGLASDNVLDIAVGTTGQMWFATDKGGSLLSVADEKWMTYTAADGLTSDFVQAILVDQAGYKWFGTLRGVSVLDDGGTSFDKSDDVWMIYTSEDGLGSSDVLAIASDDQGRKWFGTTSGLSILDDGGTPLDHSDDVWTSYTTRDGLPDNQVTAVTIDAGGNTWVGTAAGAGVFSPDDDRRVSYTVDDGMAQGFVTAIVADPSGDVWLGTWGGEQDYHSSDLFYRHSADGGKTWSSPENLSRSRSPIGRSLHLHIDTQDVIHVVWDEAQSCGYRSSSDGGEIWSQRATFYSPPSFPPIGGDEGGAPRQIVAGVGGRGEIMIAWRTASARTAAGEELPIYYQTSSDDGLSWSEPTPIPDLLARALNDTPFDAYDMAVDSAGHIHLVVVGRADAVDAPLSVLHTEWDGNSWSSPTKIFSTTDLPERPVIATSRGNQLHAVWFVRGTEGRFAGEGNYELWYSRGQSAAPSVPAPPSPTPLPTAALTPTPVPRPSSTPYPTLAPGTGGLPTGLYTESDEILQLAIALLPLILLILLVIAVKLGWLGKLFR